MKTLSEVRKELEKYLLGVQEDEKGKEQFAKYDFDNYYLMLDLTYDDDKVYVYAILTKPDTSVYLPEIYGGAGALERFKIQTTAYGSKTAAEISEIIKGYETAIKTVEKLNKCFGIDEETPKCCDKCKEKAEYTIFIQPLSPYNGNDTMNLCKKHYDEYKKVIRGIMK